MGSRANLHTNSTSTGTTSSCHKATCDSVQSPPTGEPKGSCQHLQGHHLVCVTHSGFAHHSRSPLPQILLTQTQVLILNGAPSVRSTGSSNCSFVWFFNFLARRRRRRMGGAEQGQEAKSSMTNANSLSGGSRKEKDTMRAMPRKKNRLPASIRINTTQQQHSPAARATTTIP